MSGATLKFEQLVEDHSAALFRYARWLGASSSDAQDMVQEVYLRAWQKHDQLDGIVAPRAWLRQILHNAFIDNVRVSRFELDVQDVESLWQDEGYTVDLEEILSSKESVEAIRAALFDLPFAYRSVVILHDLEDFTVAQVAAELSISLAAAKQRLRRGRMMLITALSRHRGVHEVEPGGIGCWAAREMISPFIDNELSEAEKSQVQSHLDACPTCPALFASIVKVNEVMSSNQRDPDESVDPALSQKVQSYLDEHKVRYSNSPRPPQS